MKRVLSLSLIASSMLMAGGYKIPETSLNGVALSAANIAHNKSADAAYYNPANMVFMEDKNNIELDLTYIGLDPVSYNGKVTATNVDLDSERESFIVPTIHYVSGKAGEARIGLSIVSPGGLSKRWTESPASKSAEEFTLKVIEINPTFAIPVGEKVALAFGFRIVHSEGVVKATPSPGAVYQDMTGDSIDYGYNLALAYKPTSDIDVALTYRSQVNLTVEGSADLYYAPGGLVPKGNYEASVNIPLPATASAALAYTLPSKTTVEFVYERNMWSAYKNLDFDYTNASAEAVFGTSKSKDWKDTNAFRLGLTQELDNMTLMAGMVYDESPVPSKTLGFELPDSNSLSVSLGGRYEINDKIEVGLSALYSMRETRKIETNDANDNNLVGEFTNANVLMISTGVSYKF
ncbi:long-chain fatty acid transport protein [Sulfurimonas gotlandica GD1]|uniref:Long-chain fatty acid transport protein n=1 Tax=Sulfurimonas gotlandica (strain DSM 19862 / JCM 16533 / GD1) TaxID=929558 RepID=B6BI49_SULGG|nr:outer membrane protein transport protein [Sulfurimonas gotlandica]EDZ63812.1 membrane protein [Sulfurimonas gotlandica GD1]EHP30202.1 long-chain fatty acid transport protein [Sulfurimonas gotlandica GD1]